MYQCWQTHVCNKLEKSMCSSSGHNQVRRGSDYWHRLAQAGQKFLSNPLSSLCQAMILCCFFLRTGTVQHSVIFRHFFGPHNKNKGECRSKHNHQEQRSFTCSFSFSNPLSALCQTMLLCCFFSHTRTFQHSFYVISKHFSGPHNNNNKGECRLQNQK